AALDEDRSHILVHLVNLDLHVSQHREVRADDGDDAILRCYFTCQHNVTLGSFKWYKDRVGGREVSEKSFHNRLDRTGTQTFLNKKDASITIRRVSFQDAGVYFCEVDLAGVGKANGSGTELKINKEHAHKRGNKQHMEETQTQAWVEQAKSRQGAPGPPAQSPCFEPAALQPGQSAANI
uniref:Natural cytotoxicity triggering receptor 3 n=1 Tax=Erpetoichthys calabaricus TaxID=27687 RepID=A0A8C4X5H3_ERPCA